MGARTRETMTEIEQIRSRLDETLRQLEGRMPPAARIGRRVLALAGGGVGSTVALAVLKRAVGRRLRSPKKAAQSVAPVIQVKAGIGAPAIFAAAAVYVGIKVWEAKQQEARAPLAVVSEMRDNTTRTGRTQDKRA